MSEPESKPSNRRVHLVFALAVLVGAIILLVVTEFASINGEAPPAPETPAQPAP